MGNLSADLFPVALAKGEASAKAEGQDGMARASAGGEALTTWARRLAHRNFSEGGSSGASRRHGG